MCSVVQLRTALSGLIVTEALNNLETSSPHKLPLTELNRTEPVTVKVELRRRVFAISQKITPYLIGVHNTTLTRRLPNFWGF